jgi:hypothetical protein
VFLKPIKFLGFQLKSVTDLSTDFNTSACQWEFISGEFSFNQSLNKNGDLKSSLYSLFIPHISTTNIYVFDIKSKLLTGNVLLQIKLDYPNWILFNRKAIERRGSKQIQLLVENEINVVLDKIINTYSNEKKEMQTTKKFKFLHCIENSLILLNNAITNLDTKFKYHLQFQSKLNLFKV